MSAPRVGTCYCGCGTATKGHFATGHDGRASSMLHYLSKGTSDIAELVLMAECGPAGKNLEAEARAAGWKPKTEA
jgi:hypothetical protein